MLKRMKPHFPLLALAGLSALSLGMVAALMNSSGPRASTGEVVAESPLAGWRDQTRSEDPVLDLALQPAEQRAEALTQYAQGPNSRSQHRARYLLALDWIAADRGGSALPLLEGLEADYPEMAPYILLVKAQAQTAAGQPAVAQATQNRLLMEYINDPAVAPLLYDLGQQDPTRWDDLLQRFPDHPKAVDVAHHRLTADPNRADALPLLLPVPEGWGFESVTHLCRRSASVRAFTLARRCRRRCALSVRVGLAIGGGEPLAFVRARGAMVGAGVGQGSSAGGPILPARAGGWAGRRPCRQEQARQP